MSSTAPKTGLKTGAISRTIVEAYANERSGQAFGAVGASLRKAREAAIASLLKNYARGDIIAQRISALTDEVIRTIFREAIRGLAGADQIALIATGGYGRGQLAPLSDIDLLVLHGKIDEAELKAIIDALLYPLWDAGLIVGHGVHTPTSAIKLAKIDTNACTAFLEARFLVGARPLFVDFAKRYEALRKSTRPKFTKAKISEQATRHEAALASPFLAEPDIKEGKGGLRDVHSIGWLYQYTYGRSIRKAASYKDAVTAEALQTLQRAERFLMSLRVHLHALRGRADERLTFELQPALAERLGYADRNGMSAAERMMKHYFVNALEIGRVTRIFLARLEEENAKLSDRAPRALPKMLAKDETGRAINLRLHTNRIDFAKAAQARKNPVDLFRLFRASSKRPDIGFHPDALALVTECLPQVTKAVRRDEEITKLFLATLNEPKDPARVLRVMSETGLLGKFLPSFGQITGRIEYGLYRRFPLDEHIFRSIGMLAQLRTGALQEMHPIATGIVKRTKDATALSLTVLLHETRPSADPDDEALSEALVGRVVRRLGVDDELASRIAWVAARPYLLMRIAERRNLGQTRAIARFAEQVGDIESLELLLVLTVCRLRVISDTAWDAWTRTQVSALYFGARASIEGGEAGLIDWFRERGKATAQELARKLPGWSVKELEAFLETVSGELASALPTESLARVAELVAGARAGKLTSAVSAVVSEDVVEAIVYTRDRPGLLSNLAGAISESAGAVRSVHAMTGADGYVIDVFTIQFAEGVDGQSLTELARRVHPALLGVAKTPPKKPPVLSKRLGDRRAIFEVEPTVRLDLEASDDCLVVEAEGRDRPGLLYRLSSALAEIGVQIKSAHIATYGERAVDAFYLQDSPGYKITDKRRLQSIERRLLAVLAGD